MILDIWQDTRRAARAVNNHIRRDCYLHCRDLAATPATTIPDSVQREMRVKVVFRPSGQPGPCSPMWAEGASLAVPVAMLRTGVGAPICGGG